MGDRNYRLEAEKKLLKFIQENDDHREQSMSDSKKILVKEQKRRDKNAIKANQASITNSNESSALSMETYLPTTYRVTNLILDSYFVATNYRKNSNLLNQFILKLSDPLRNVVAIRILRTEFINLTDSQDINYVALKNAYIYFNGYINTFIANETNTQIYGRLIAGTEIYPGISSDIRNDPFVYIFRPIENSLSRFEIKILNGDGSLYDFHDNNIQIVITLAVYTIPNIAR